MLARPSWRLNRMGASQSVSQSVARLVSRWFDGATKFRLLGRRPERERERSWKTARAQTQTASQLVRDPFYYLNLKLFSPGRHLWSTCGFRSRLVWHTIGRMWCVREDFGWPVGEPSSPLGLSGRPTGQFGQSAGELEIMARPTNKSCPRTSVAP